MSFYPQPDDYSCGPFALKHALVTLGKFASESELKAAAGTHWWSGTSELGLERAARSVGCNLELARKRTSESARKELNAWLRARYPVVTCVDGWAHWISVLSESRGQYVIVDSNLDPVLDVVGWSQLSKRIRYLDTDYHDEDPPELYDLLAVIPRGRVTMRADLSATRVKFLRRSANRDLATNWNAYVDDLLTICRPRSTNMQRPLSMAELLRRHGELVASRVCYWHGEVSAREVERVLERLRFVAEAYGLVIPRELETAGDRRSRGAHGAVGERAVLLDDFGQE